MIAESLYIEMMKNCSKWNSRVEAERKNRYPVLDAQTGVAQRPAPHAVYTTADRYPPSQPSQYCTYVSKRWKKRKTAPTSDATEMKYILQCNPMINEVFNQANSSSQGDSLEFPVSVDTPNTYENYFTEKRSRIYDVSMDGELEEPSEEEQAEASEEDDWTEGKKRRKKRGGPGGSRPGRKSNAALAVSAAVAQAGTPDPKPFICHLCGAKYKSRPGLNYHRAHVHPDSASPCGTPQPHLLSPSIEMSNICDLCLGDINENKKTSQPERLVSCHDCGRSGHPTCLKFTDNMLISTNKYGWQCIECKSCAICGFSDNDDQLLFCDDCDRGFHLYCLRPPLSKAPDGEWSCYLCQKEFGAKASLPIVVRKA